ncbi:hypothetical protein [Peribacillus deserti]|uniref:hypothetical protein n=1 Tax=Peribacillus deserti TaxID=673318 RepID=UPI0015E1270E|nr:hypothetical protein [Peribacillus deserti]
MRFLMKTILLSAVGAAAYKYRYPIMNRMLSMPAVRSLVVSTSMKSPLLRGKFLQNMFE